MSLTLQLKSTSLVDQVEECLLSHFKSSDLQIGDPIPNELTLAEELGVARSVLRECLSRLKMMGMIHSRPRKGMILSEPSILGGMKRVIDPRFLSEHTVLDLLEFRISLEIGISSSIMDKITDEDIEDLRQIVERGKVMEYNEYAVSSEYSFHSRLYQITSNQTISEFQNIIHPILTYIKEQFCDELSRINRMLQLEGKTVSHADLLECLEKRDRIGYMSAIDRHFLPYRIFLKEREEKLAEEEKNSNGDSGFSLS